MKIIGLILLGVLVAQINFAKTGTAPICTFDGNYMGCFYWTWEECESVRLDYERCIANPDL
jgi:hypothetical protein